MATTALSNVSGKDDIHYVANTDDPEKCSQDTKSDEDSIKSNPKRSDNTLDRSLRSLAHLKQTFRPFSTPKKIVEKISADKDKNDPAKFLGDGVTFKAKLIGILEVDSARGDRMCQEALNELKMAVRAAGEHKLRINIVISIEGLRLRDEKTGDCLYHHPVHKISFIAQDVADSRAFGYIYGSPDMGHKFFGIKTDKSASQVVIAMRDLFQVVYELKKREVELAKHNIEQHQLKYGSNYFLDSISATSSKSGGNESATGKPKVAATKEDTAAAAGKGGKGKNQTAGVIADLMDLELELNSLQQGLSQMERITPSDPFGPSSAASTSKEDPFGDSFTPPPTYTMTGTPPPTKIPPPPTSGDRRKVTTNISAATGSSTSALPSELHWFDKETQNLFENDVFSASVQSSGSGKSKLVDDNQQRQMAAENAYKLSKDLFDIFTELDPLGTGKIKPYVDKKDFFQELKNPVKRPLKDLAGNDETADGVLLSSKTDKDFVIDGGTLAVQQNNLTTDDSTNNNKFRLPPADDDDEVQYNITSSDFQQPSTSSAFTASFPSASAFDADVIRRSSPGISSGKVVRKSPLIQSDSSSSQGSVHGLLKSAAASAANSSKKTSRARLDEQDERGGDEDNNNIENNGVDRSFRQMQRHQQWSRMANNHVRQKIVINLRKVLSAGDDTDKENDSPVAEDTNTDCGIVLRNPDATVSHAEPSSADSFESIPEPPPRPTTSSPATITSLSTASSQPPPPLPPKKLHVPVTMKPPPRPPSSSDIVASHYDYIENYESSFGRRPPPDIGGQQEDAAKIPPIPAPARKSRFNSYDSDYLDSARKRPPPQQRLVSSSSSPEYYLTPIQKNYSKDDVQQRGNNNNNSSSVVTTTGGKGKITPPLDMTLKQLTNADFNDIADVLGIDPNRLSKMTLKDLAVCLSSQAHTAGAAADNEDSRVEQGKIDDTNKTDHQKFPSFEVNFDKKFPVSNSADKNNNNNDKNNKTVDKYAVFRELIEQEEKKQNRPSSSEGGGAISAEDNEDEHSKKLSDSKNKDNDDDDDDDDNMSADRYAALRIIVENQKDIATTESVIALRDTAIPPSDSSVTTTAAEEQERIQEPPPPPDVKISEIEEIPLESVQQQQQQEGDLPVTNFSAELTTEQQQDNSSFRKDWAKFDTFDRMMMSPLQQQQQSGKTSPWATSSELGEKEFPSEKTVVSPMFYGGHRDEQRCMERKKFLCKRWDDEDDEYYEEEECGGGEDIDDDNFDDEYYGDDSEENWGSSKKSLASSWDESSWKENGWSDRDSLYGETTTTPSPTYREHRGYQIKKKGYQRKFSPHKKPPPASTTSGFEVWRKEGRKRLHNSSSSSNRPGAGSKNRSTNYETPIVYGPPAHNSVPWFAETYEKTTPVALPPSTQYGGGGYHLEHSPPDYVVPPTADDELKVLKLMLGEKRLKELGDRLYTQYLRKEHHHHPANKSPMSTPPGYYYDYPLPLSPPKAAVPGSTPPEEVLMDNDEDVEYAGSGKYSVASLRSKIKQQQHHSQVPRQKGGHVGYYTTSGAMTPQRIDAAGKARRWEDEEIRSHENYSPHHHNRSSSRRYSQDELSPSEEDEAAHHWRLGVASPPVPQQPAYGHPYYYNNNNNASSSRNRLRTNNQPSSFEDNFSPKESAIVGRMESPPLFDKEIVYFKGKNATRSRYSTTKLPATSSAAESLKQSINKEQQQPHKQYHHTHPGVATTTTTNATTAITTTTATTNSVVSPPELMVNDRRSRAGDSSQRQSPFEDDFAPPTSSSSGLLRRRRRQRSNDRSISGDLIVKEDAVAASRDAAYHSSSLSDPISRSSGYRYHRDEESFGGYATTTRTTSNRYDGSSSRSKHYENVMFRRQQLPITDDVFRYDRKRLGSAKELARYKSSAAGLPGGYIGNRRVAAANSGVQMISPKKCAAKSSSMHYDPFNDKTVAAVATVAVADDQRPTNMQQPKMTKPLSEDNIQNSGGTSDADNVPPLVVTSTDAAAAAPVSWKEDFSSFDFSDHAK